MWVCNNSTVKHTETDKHFSCNVLKINKILKTSLYNVYWYVFWMMLQKTCII